MAVRYWRDFSASRCFGEHRKADGTGGVVETIALLNKKIVFHLSTRHHKLTIAHADQEGVYEIEYGHFVNQVVDGNHRVRLFSVSIGALVLTLSPSLVKTILYAFYRLRDDSRPARSLACYPDLKYPGLLYCRPQFYNRWVQTAIYGRINTSMPAINAVLKVVAERYLELESFEGFCVETGYPIVYRPSFLLDIGITTQRIDGRMYRLRKMPASRERVYRERVNTQRHSRQQERTKTSNVSTKSISEIISGEMKA